MECERQSSEGDGIVSVKLERIDEEIEICPDTVVYSRLNCSRSIISQNLPKPKLGFVTVSETVNNGVAVRMYEVEVENRGKFDNDLFVPSPGLGACGRNPYASRTWLNIYDGDGIRLYG
jgi:hypothetical protein